MAVDRETHSHLERLLRPLRNRVANALARAVVQLVDDAKKLQLLQLGVLADEDVPDAEHFQPYGFSSVPLAGAEAVVAFPNGDRGHPLAVVISDRRYRPSGGQGGEVVLYTDEGDTIRLGRGHVISLATTGQVKLGSASATEGAVKGTQRNTAEQTFLTALTTYVNGIKPIVDAGNILTPPMVSAISAFAAAVAAAVSTKVKLE